MAKQFSNFGANQGLKDKEKQEFIFENISFETYTTINKSGAPLLPSKNSPNLVINNIHLDKFSKQDITFTIIEKGTRSIVRNVGISKIEIQRRSEFFTIKVNKKEDIAYLRALEIQGTFLYLFKQNYGGGGNWEDAVIDPENCFVLQEEADDAMDMGNKNDIDGTISVIFRLSNFRIDFLPWNVFPIFHLIDRFLFEKPSKIKYSFGAGTLINRDNVYEIANLSEQWVPTEMEATQFDITAMWGYPINSANPQIWIFPWATKEFIWRIPNPLKAHLYKTQITAGGEGESNGDADPVNDSAIIKDGVTTPVIRSENCVDRREPKDCKAPKLKDPSADPTASGEKWRLRGSRRFLAYHLRNTFSGISDVSTTTTTKIDPIIWDLKENDKIRQGLRYVPNEEILPDKNTMGSETFGASFEGIYYPELPPIITSLYRKVADINRVTVGTDQAGINPSLATSAGLLTGAVIGGGLALAGLGPLGLVFGAVAGLGLASIGREEAIKETRKLLNATDSMTDALVRDYTNANGNQLGFAKYFFIGRNTFWNGTIEKFTGLPNKDDAPIGLKIGESNISATVIDYNVLATKQVFTTTLSQDIKTSGTFSIKLINPMVAGDYGHQQQVFVANCVGTTPTELRGNSNGSEFSFSTKNITLPIEDGAIINLFKNPNYIVDFKKVNADTVQITSNFTQNLDQCSNITYPIVRSIRTINYNGIGKWKIDFSQTQDPTPIPQTNIFKFFNDGNQGFTEFSYKQLLLNTALESRTLDGENRVFSPIPDTNKFIPLEYTAKMSSPAYPYRINIKSIWNTTPFSISFLDANGTELIKYENQFHINAFVPFLSDTDIIFTY